MRLIDADVVLKRIKNAIAFYSHPTQGDFDTGRKIGLISAKEIVAEEVTNAEHLPAEWKEVEPHELICTNCGGYAPMNYMHEHYVEATFCPHCGAKMQKGD